MLANSKAFGGFSVDDIPAAKAFYGGKLGLNVTDEAEGTISIHLAGDNTVIAYPKPDHQPATFTILNFPVDDIGEAVKGLKALGITFEHYPDFTDDDGIHRSGGPFIAWFKDPSGNILSIIEVK